MVTKDQNPSNDHGFEFLSYIYGELDDTARDSFEEHLTRCDDCTFELAGYSDARLGVIEWRREDFDHLESPAIVIPWASHKDPAAAQVGRSGAISRFIETLSSFPLFVKAGMGLVAASMAFGVFYFGTGPSTRQTVDLAANKSVQTKPFSAPSNTPDSDGESGSVAVKLENAPSREVRNASEHPQTVRRSVVAVKVNVRQPLVRRSETALASKSVTKSVPTLSSVEEEKDNSLRLADLFAEIGSSEE